VKVTNFVSSGVVLPEVRSTTSIQWMMGRCLRI